MSRRIDPAPRKPATIRLATGDSLALEVPAPADGFATVQIAGTGLSAPALEGAPARLDFLADEPGRYAIEEAEAGRTLGTIVVTRPRRN